MPRLLVFFFLLCLGAFSRAQDGLYVDFQTSLGNFTCQLDYVRAPRTVANFVGLATGERAWLNFANGEISHQPFYRGLTFHRVLTGFVIQGGSPKGDGSDGPGYTFRDEFDPALRHDEIGVLSMANSGLNTNGSQFFITLGTPTYLDDVHSVFGKISAGPFGTKEAGVGVLQTIGNTPVNSPSVGLPLTPVVMNSVTIRRVGAAAQAFNIQAQGLPTVGGNALKLIRPTPSTLAVQIARSAGSEYRLFHSANLTSWTTQYLAYDSAAAPPANVDATSVAGLQRYFFRVAETSYPAPLYTPPTLLGKTLVCTLTSNSLATPVQTTITYTFTSSTAGTSSADGGTAGAFAAQWTQEPYRGQLAANSQSVPYVELQFSFNSATAGVVKGTVYAATGYTCTGTFTLTP